MLAARSYNLAASLADVVVGHKAEFIYIIFGVFNVFFGQGASLAPGRRPASPSAAFASYLYAM